MKPITEERQQALIADCEKDITRLRRWCENYKELFYQYSSELQRQEIALVSLTAEAIGSLHIYQQSVEATSDYVKDGEWPIDDGELVVYSAPPVPVIKLPDAKDLDDARYAVPGSFSAGRDVGFNECLAEIKRRLNIVD